MKLDSNLTSLTFARIIRLAIVSSGVYLSTLSSSFAAPGDIIDVSTPSQLQNALSTATGGETIRLATGNYGAVDIHDRAYSSYVSLKSANANRGAVFTNIELKRSSFVRIDGVTVEISAREGVGIFDASHHIQVLNSEIFGQNQFDRDNPSFEQASTLYAVNTNGDVHNILIENIDAHDIKSSAYLFTGISNSTIRENKCDWVASDCFKLANADGILFENNFGARNIHSSPTAHVDFVQGQGRVSNSVFRGNVALIASQQSFQGLFFDDATFTNLTFEDNLISTTSIRGISVSSPDGGTPSSGIVARNNTVLISGGAFKASLILIPSGSISENNIVSSSVTKNRDRFNGGNIVAQWDEADDIAHYDDYYVNADRGRGAMIEDFRPVVGSVAENEKGAFRRILELLEGDSTSNGFISPIIPLLLDDDD